MTSDARSCQALTFESSSPVMKRFHPPFLPLAVAALMAVALLAAAPALAREAYVTDEFEITMRTGPSLQNKVLRMVESGSRLTLFEEQEGWVRVRDARGREGWVLKRYITSETPKALVITRLERENEKLRTTSTTAQSKSEEVGAQNAELKTSLDAARSELTQVKQELAELKKDAASVMELRGNYEQTRSTLTQTAAEVERLQVENRDLRTSSRLRWFLIGAGVVFGSWLVGFVLGRIRRRPKSSLNFR